MAIIQWRGGAGAVAQVSSASVDTYDAATTYTLSVGSYALSVTAQGSAGATAAALVSAANTSTVPYFSAVAWTNPSGGDITGTAETAGAPFDAVLSVSGGTGTRTDFSDDTACTGPHHAGNVSNYEGGELPTSSDDLIIAAGTSILYELDALAGVALASTEVRKTFSNLIGLNPNAFSTSLDGGTTNASYIEYRATHLELDSPIIRIGDHDGGGSPSGSQRVFLHQQSTSASRLLVVDTASSVAGAAPAVDYLADDADADVDVRSAPAGCGIASFAGDTATVGDIIVSDTTQTSEVVVGAGATYAEFRQFGGRNRIRAAANVTTVEAQAGTLEIDGEGYAITTLIVGGSSNVEDVHLNTAGAEWTTINVQGGTLELPKVYDAGSDRSFTTMNVSRGRVEADWSALTGTVVVAADAGVSARFSIDAAAL